jgi:hypothetical protein
MVFVAYITSPFVANIHLRLPAFARYNREILMRYSSNLPKDAKLEFTTMNFIGKPRVSLVSLDQLYPTRGRLGMVNYTRDTAIINAKRSWWMGRATRLFGVHGGVRTSHGAGVWENISQTIVKRSMKSM